MLSFHVFAIHQLRRSTSLIPAAACPIRFRHKAKSSSQQPLWNLHLQTVTPVTFRIRPYENCRVVLVSPTQILKEEL